MPAPELNLLEVFDALKSIDDSAITMAFRKISYSDFLESTYWRSVSLWVKKRDGSRCKVCDRHKFLQAHHRNYSMPRGSEHLHLDDLTTLCGPCHSLFHNKEKAPAAGLTKGQQKAKRKIERQARAAKRKLKRHEIEQQSQTAIPEHGKIILTKELIDACKTKGSFSAVAMMALSPHDLKKGWTTRLLGTAISRENYERALAGRERTHKFIREETAAIRRKANEQQEKSDQPIISQPSEPDQLNRQL